MTILIAVLLSSWDGSYQSHHEIAKFDTYVQCQNAATKIEQANPYAKTQYLCVKEGIK